MAGVGDKGLPNGLPVDESGEFELKDVLQLVHLLSAVELQIRQRRLLSRKVR